MTPERTVLLVGLLVGLLLTALTPPFQAPDETRHFLRIYQISEGVLFPRAGRAELPESVVRVEAGYLDFQFQPKKKTDLETWREAAALPLAPGRRLETGIGGAALSTPAPYLPQALAALAGREMELPPLAILYLCRVANLLAALAVAWLAVRVAPFYRWLFAFLALDPMALFLRSSASPDALTNAMALLLVASVLALAGRGSVGFRGSAPSGAPRGQSQVLGSQRSHDLLLLLGSAAFLVLAKGASYLLLPALVLLIPAEGWRNRRRRVATLGLLIALTLAGAGLSGWAARRAFTQLRPEVAADPAAQLARIVERPGHFLGIVLADAVRHAPLYAIQFVGNLGWLDIPLPAPVLLGYALLLTALALLDGAPDFPLGAGRRLLVVAITAGTLLAVFASQYLLWTAVGADFVEGVQGRYFLPLAPAAALLFLNRRWARDLDRAGRWLFGAAVFTTAVTLVKVGLRYYRF